MDHKNRSELKHQSKWVVLSYANPVFFCHVLSFSESLPAPPNLPHQPEYEVTGTRRERET